MFIFFILFLLCFYFLGTLLTVIIIKEKFGEIIEPKLLENLKENDPYRRNYYSDWSSYFEVTINDIYQTQCQNNNYIYFELQGVDIR